MPRSTKVTQPPCLCRRLHVDCSPKTCPQAQHASSGDWNHYTIRAFRESAAGSAQAPPCKTCAAVVQALTEVDEIRQILRGSVEDLRNRGGGGMCEGAAEDYEMMLVVLEAPIHAVASPPASSEQGSSTSSLISAAAKEDTRMRGAGRRIIRTCAAKDGSENWRHFNIWQEESDGWESKGCRAVPPLACHPVRRTDEDAATEQLKSWLATCDTVHGCVPAQGARAPTRLIKVSENQVRLTQTTGELMRYTTLSHR